MKLCVEKPKPVI